MKGLLSLAYSLAVDRLITERERKKKVIESKLEINEINKYILTANLDPKHKKSLSRNLLTFSKEIQHYTNNTLDNVLNVLQTLKLGAKVLNYVSKDSNPSKIVTSLESIVKKIEFSEFVDSEDFSYELINNLDEALDSDDYVTRSFKNKTLNELKNKIKFEKVAYSALRNFTIAAPNYFLDDKIRVYKLKSKKISDTEAIFHFSHGKTMRLSYSNKLDTNIRDDVTVFVLPQLTNEEKELMSSFFDKDHVLLVYSIADDKIYYNKKDARALYFAEYFNKNVPPTSEKILSKISKKRGVYASAELGIDDSLLPFDLEDNFWR